MNVRKNEQGEHYVTILVPPDRGRRKRYQKTPIVRTGNGFLGWLRDLMRGGPNPFLASPIATAIDRRLRIEKQARRAEERGAEVGDGIMAQADAALARYLRGSADEADRQLDELDRFADEEKDFLENCRPAAIKANLEFELDRIANDVNAELGPAATALARRRVGLENFIADNRIERAIWWGKPVTHQSIYLFLAITLFEFLLNTAFFSGSQRSGIIGGAALALLLSITTIILGLGFGIAFQFSHHRAEGRGWFGRTGILGLLAVTLYYLLLLTLARLAGEAGDTHMFAAAAREIQLHPFAGLLDLPALAYLFFSIAVIAGVFYKFIDTMGHYPRIRSHRLAAEKAESEFESIRFGMIEAARTATDDSIRALDATPNIIQATIRAIRDLVMNYENVVDQFKNDVRDIKDASRLLVGVVRQHVAVDEALRPQFEFDEEIAKIDARLERFRGRAAGLQEWDQINPAAVDRCRADMVAFGKAELALIETRCEEVGRERYTAAGGAGTPMPQATPSVASAAPALEPAQ